uniref:Cytochrome P450 n=1 Tax=Timema monikensis TaxID=170555 RepID=A0A7R9EHL6_9NEOP|nr:unnamed protein product [Timema monikensis]
MGIVLTILITTIIILIYNRFTNIFSYWRLKRVPFVQPLKVNNKLKDVLLSRIDLEDVFEMVYSELEGHELGGFYKFLQPCLMARSPDVIETILVTRFDCFHDNWSHVCHEVDPLASRSLFFMTGDRGIYAPPSWAVLPHLRPSQSLFHTSANERQAPPSCLKM